MAKMPTTICDKTKDFEHFRVYDVIMLPGRWAVMDDSVLKCTTNSGEPVALMQRLPDEPTVPN